MDQRIELPGAIGGWCLALLLLTAPLAAADSSDRARDLRARIQHEQIPVRDLRIADQDGILFVSGEVLSRYDADLVAGIVARSGAARVANLIRVSAPVDDETLRRDVERALYLAQVLNDARLAVRVRHGIIDIYGSVRDALQEAATIDVIRNVDGVVAVRSYVRTRSS